MADLTVRRLGNSGLAVSTVGLGCNNLGRPGTVTEDLAGTTTVISAALDAGVNLFDTADVYGGHGRSEELLGRALGHRRGDALIATKFGSDMAGGNGADFGARGSRRYIVAAVHASLRRLRTDWIDLYQIHRPDPATPIEETLAALDDLVRAGTVRYIGHSNFAGWQLADAAWTARTARATPFVSAQNEYSLLRREAETDLLPAAAAFGVGVLPYFPLASGLLTGKYRRDEAPAGSRLASRPDTLANARWDVVEAVRGFADERGISMLQVAFGWLLARPAVASVIAGATRPAQVQANVAAASWVPAVEDLAELDRITAS